MVRKVSLHAHLKRFTDEYIKKDSENRVETALVVWCYDHADLVSPIKAWTQSGRGAGTASCEQLFDMDSRLPLVRRREVSGDVEDRGQS